MILHGKTVDYATLKADLIAAGIPMPHDLGQDGDDLHTYDDDGVYKDLPTEAAAVIAAHVPPAPAPTRDERLLAAVDAAKTAVGGGAFTPTQAATLQAVFDGLGAAITESPT